MTTVQSVGFRYTLHSYLHADFFHFCFYLQKINSIDSCKLAGDVPEVLNTNWLFLNFQLDFHGPLQQVY